MVGETSLKIGCCCNQRATNNYTAKGKPRWSRVLSRAFERVELLEGELSRAVLRGGDDGNIVSLPDGWKRARKSNALAVYPIVEVTDSSSVLPTYPCQTRKTGHLFCRCPVFLVCASTIS